MGASKRWTNICVNGSRACNDEEFVRINLVNTIASMSTGMITFILGGAIGADTLAFKFARDNKFCIEEYLPDWKEYGKAAGMIRNSKMIERADVLISFWDGESKGTRDTINKALNKGIETHVFIFNDKKELLQE